MAREQRRRPDLQRQGRWSALATAGVKLLKREHRQSCCQSSSARTSPRLGQSRLQHWQLMYLKFHPPRLGKSRV